MGIGKWQVSKQINSQKPITTNSAAVMLLSCSTTTDARSPLKDCPKSSPPQATLLSHTGQCFSPRLLNPPRSKTFSPTSPPPVVVVVPPLDQLPLLKRKSRKRKRRKKPKMSIWEVSSEMMMMTIELISKVP